MTERKKPTTYIRWYRSQIEKQDLRRLRESSNLKGWIQAGGHFALLLLAGFACWLAYKNLAWPYLVMSLLSYGVIQGFLHAGVHELAHGHVFRSQGSNKFFFKLTCFLTWTNPDLFWISHRRHHAYTLHQPHDLEVVLPQKLGLVTFLLRSVIDLPGMFEKTGEMQRMCRGKPGTAWEKTLLPESSPAKRKRVFGSARKMLVIHLLVAIILTSQGLGLLAVLISGGSFLGSAILVLVALPQHIGMKPEVPDFRLSCRTIYINPVWRFLYWNMNYHIEHHMYPAVPCYRLPELHSLIKHDLPPTPNGIYQTWSQIIATQLRQRRDPSYSYEALLPEKIGGN